MKARAPGKAFLCGEYAVLEGATAVVAAVARHAIADTNPERGAPSQRREVQAVARALSEKRGAVVVPWLDTSALEHDGRKLGLGSSAAAAAAAATAILAEVGVDLARPEAREAWLETIADAHRAAQGGVGSGGDVAASLWGGVVAVQIGPPLRVAPFRLHPEVAVVLADAGGGARTAALAAAARDAGLPKALREAAPALADALQRGRAQAIRAAVDLHRAGMADLGTAVGHDLLPASFQRLAAVAVDAGGGAQPPGAGGGELAVVFARGRAAGARVCRALTSAGFWAEVASIDRKGAQLEEEGAA